MMITPCKDCPARHLVCHDLCLRFVASSYDLEIIREEERKQ